MFRRFSIAKLFLWISVCAVMSLVVRQAFLGQPSAQAIAFVLAAGLCWLVLHLVLTLIGYLVMRAQTELTPRRAQAPFATEVPAPQIIPPKNIDSQ